MTKQATRPEGSRSLGLAGTAPGLVLRTASGCVVVVLPGPPAELQRLWPRALETEELAGLLARTRPPGRRVLRLFGVSESAVARALAEAGGDGDGVEATICARDFEIHVDLMVEPGADARADALEAALTAPLERWLYGARRAPGRGARPLALPSERTDARHGRVVHRGARGGAADLRARVERRRPRRHRRVCERGQDRASSACSEELLATHGAVSPEAAEAMARGARERLGADVAVAVTGVAGPGGGTPEKPVGLVYLHAEGPDGGLGRELSLPGRPRDDPGPLRGRRAPSRPAAADTKS